MPSQHPSRRSAGAPGTPGADDAEGARPAGDEDPLQDALDPGPEPGESGARRAIADTVRKAVMTGLGAVFLTEENARKFARDWKLPKDIATYIAGQAGGAKDEIVRVVSEEIRKFFESPVLRREVLRMVQAMSIEVHAEIRLRPARRGPGATTHVKVHGVRPRLTRSRDRGGGDEE